MLNRRLLLGAVLMATAQVLIGCKEAKLDANQPVRYKGTSLFVMGVEYKREARPEFAPAKGVIQVTARKGMESQLEQLLLELSLNVTTMRGKTFIVAVPADFERQWAEALASQSVVLFSGLE